ncbi:MAG: tRNA pseudouridine(55) synthase TruB [Chloroflexota bacterium]|nr:tRNA pseudouridine(55) synthase TruB [Chloroflexota bacterium]MDE2909151.1 tRNA pseudouridine(55) synthase TruB [Chloroflexota bacterium]
MSEFRADGFLNLNKPLHLTSHDVVAQVRRHYRALTGSKKVGHAGTLDPLAEGVLVICLGAATRLSEYIMRGTKTYQARITVGISTTSYDAAGEILERKCAAHIRRADIERALPRFIGEIEQAPPMYSAVKVGGVKLYELARQGRTIEREPRAITVRSIAVQSWRNPVAELEIECGAGTYIRSLAQDLGEALGVGAHLSGLTRTASGAFKLRDSLSLEEITGSGAWLGRVTAPYDALSAYPRVKLKSADIDALRHGRFIERQPDIVDQTVFAFDHARRLVAILEPRAALWKPRKVFVSRSI